jgi:hypothetical protein
VSNRRKLKPSELARQDQAVAAGRDLATNTRSAVITIAYAEQDHQCSWCDCPAPVDDPESPHNQAGFECGGCPETARYVAIVAIGREERFPVCVGHADDFHGVMTRTIQKRYGDIPTHHIETQILDEEAAG